MYFLRRRASDSLPLSSSRSSVEGSGKSIRMEAPIVRRIKSFSLYTKLSYAILLFGLFLITSGWRHIIRHNASHYLSCHFSGCDLHIKLPGQTIFKTKIHRQQLVKTDHVRVTRDGEIMSHTTNHQHHYDPPQPREGNRSNRKKKAVNPDRKKLPPDDLYDSYTLTLRDYDPATMGRMDEEISSGKYKSLHHHHHELKHLDGIGIVPNDNNNNNNNNNNNSNEYTFLMRRYNLNKRRGSARGQHSRLKNYIHSKRNKVTIREDRGPDAIGVLALVFGIFTFLMVLLLGQFWEEREGFVSRRGGAVRKNAAMAKTGGRGMRTGRVAVGMPTPGVDVKPVRRRRC